MCTQNRIGISIFALFLCFGFRVSAAKVDTVVTYSKVMDKSIKAVVITPDSYTKTKEYPVVYLLHGHSGNYGDWVKKVPQIKAYADQYGTIIVCPDGNYSSWYLDSPEDPKSQYETYITSELISWMDTEYSTKHTREGRAIMGLSMGGHGAFYLAFRHQDVFSMAGSMSGGVDLRPFPNNWEIYEVLGTFSEYPQRWKDNSVVSLVPLLKPNALKIIFTCGSEDFFYEVNNELHEVLLQQKIPHTYISAPGGHVWDFWEYSIYVELDYLKTCGFFD